MTAQLCQRGVGGIHALDGDVGRRLACFAELHSLELLAELRAAKVVIQVDADQVSRR